MAIETAREAYMVQWITRLLQRVKRSGLDSIPFDEAWHHARHPVMVGMPMVDPVLHRFTDAEFRDVAARHFRLEGDSLLVPEHLSTMGRQDVVQPRTPFSNRKLLADRMTGAPELLYFDPYVGSAWLGTLHEILALTDPPPRTIKLLTSDSKLTSASARETFASLTRHLATELGISIEVRTTAKEHARFFTASHRVWKIGHSLNNLDQFEGLDEQVERKQEWLEFWDASWSAAAVVVTT